MIAILCHNPTAGLEAFPKKDLIAALKLARFDSVYCSTKDDDFSDQLHQPADLIVVAGGDGPVAKVVKNMPDRSVPIAIIPLAQPITSPARLVLQDRPTKSPRAGIFTVLNCFGLAPPRDHGARVSSLKVLGWERSPNQ